MLTCNTKDEYMEDPLSPFHPSDTSTYTSNIKKPLPKTELDFLEKVTKSTADTLYWDSANKVREAMGVKTMSSSSAEAAKNAVQAFKAAGRRRRVKEEVSQFCTETSFTPLVLIYNASSWMRRIGWMLVFIGMAIWLTFQCYWLLEKYFAYPIEVKLDLKASKVLDFPSVTICNLNPIKASALRSQPEFRTVKHYAEGIKADDKLYDFFYKNMDSMLSTVSTLSTTWNTGSTTPVSPLTSAESTTGGSGGPSGTGPGSTTPVSPLTPAESTTGGSGGPSGTGPGSTTSVLPLTPVESTTGGTGGSSGGPPGGPGPGKRRKRDASQAEIQGPPLNDITSFDQSKLPTNHDLSKSMDSGLPQTLENDDFQILNNINSDETDTKTFTSAESSNSDAEEEDWERFENYFDEQFHHLDRVRRSAGNSSEKLKRMISNSFNKWDMLSNNRLNTSYYGTRGVEYQTAMAYATVTAQMDEKKVKASGHNLNDLMLSCQFNGWPCSPSNFTYFHNHKFGNCYTFNDKTSPTVARTKSPGPDFGLTLEMYIQQSEYVPALAAEAGLRVLVHPRGSAPFPEDEGVSVPPGHATSLSIRMSEVIRLEPPHGTCQHGGSSMDMYASTRNMTYSKLACLKSCYQAISRVHCNCSMPMYVVTEGSDVCNMTDCEVDTCTSDLPETRAEEYTQCDAQCPQPCYQVGYDMVVSSAAWPSQHYQGYLDTKVKQCNYILMGSKLQDDDFVKLNVYFTDLMYQKIEQQRAYESQNLISDIGGQLGLWLGLSAITIGELCGLFLVVFRSVTASDDGKKVRPSGFSLSKKTPELHLTDVEDDVMPADVKARGYV